MTKALISIDYSYDFVADDGKLTAGKPAQAIEDRIAQVTQELSLPHFYSMFYSYSFNLS